MRRLAVKILVLLALLWGGWWWFASDSLQKGAARWMDAQSAQGITAGARSWSRSGFPLRIATTAQDVTWADAATNTSVQLPEVTLSTPIQWPGDARIEIPAGPVTVQNVQGVATITTDGAEAEMLLHPSSALQLEALSAKATDVSVDLVEGRIITVETLQADIHQNKNPATYQVDLTAIGVAFGSILQEGLQIPATWPKAFEPIIADMTIEFDKPWDRNAVQLNRPQPRRISIEKVEAIYANLGFALTGDVDVDTAGIPSGVVNVQVRNWQQIFDMLVAVTDVPVEWRGTIEQVLGAMADLDGTLNLDITLAQGQMRMGFLSLGPAPRLTIP